MILGVNLTQCLNLLTALLQIHKYKYEFNQRLLKLRNKKIRVIEEIKSLVNQLSDVYDKLPDAEVRELPPVPEMDLEELPEKSVFLLVLSYLIIIIILYINFNPFLCNLEVLSQSCY